MDAVPTTGLRRETAATLETAMRLRYTPPLELPRIDVDALTTSSVASICLETGFEPRCFGRYAPAYIDDPEDTGLFRGLAADHYVSPPAYVLSIPDATAFGYRALAWNGHFCVDDCLIGSTATGQFLSHMASGDSFLGEDTGFRPTYEPGVFDLPLTESSIRHIPQTVLSLCSHEPSNYGSFLFRVMAKLATVTKLGLDRFSILVWAHPPVFQRYLAMAGVTRSRIIQHDTHAPTRFDRVIAPSLRNPHAFLDPESLAFFRHIAAQCAGGGLGRRLYISRLGQARRGASSRRMTNEAEVAEMVTRLGFTVIEPEALTPEQQVAAFANADVVAGPSGSAMFNCVFCRPGTKILDIESEPHWIYAHTGLFASCALDYGLFVAATDPADATPVHKRFQVNIPTLQDRLTKLVAT